jgi:hypothetical protein
MGFKTCIRENPDIFGWPIHRNFLWLISEITGKQRIIDLNRNVYIIALAGKQRSSLALPSAAIVTSKNYSLKAVRIILRGT